MYDNLMDFIVNLSLCFQHDRSKETRKLRWHKSPSPKKLDLESCFVFLVKKEEENIFKKLCKSTKYIGGLSNKTENV